MNLHIGDGDWIALEHLVCVVNAADMSEDTRNFLGACAKRGGIRRCAGKPKAYIVTRDGTGKETVFAAPVGPGTLYKRWADACLHDSIRRIAHLTVDGL